MSQSKEVPDDIRPLSSVPLQTLFYFDELFSGYGLFYPSNTIGVEVFLLFAFGFIQFSRIYIGSVGNKTEATPQIAQFLIICLPAVFFFVFFLRLQTYVIILELILNSIGIAFLSLEFLFSISAFFSFKNDEK